MKFFLTKVTVVAITVILTVVWMTMSSSARGSRVRDSGRAIFQRYCSNCHGDDGRANTPRGRRKGAKDLTKSTVSVNMGIKIITYGKGEMPEFKDRLSNSDIRSVNTFVRSLRK